MLDTRFSYTAFVEAGDRSRLVQELAAELTRRLQAASDAEAEARVLVQELRTLGHDLWSFDESLDFQIWCGDWVTPEQHYELILELRYESGTRAHATATFRERMQQPRG